MNAEIKPNPNVVGDIDYHMNKHKMKDCDDMYIFQPRDDIHIHKYIPVSNQNPPGDRHIYLMNELGEQLNIHVDGHNIYFPPDKTMSSKLYYKIYCDAICGLSYIENQTKKEYSPTEKELKEELDFMYNSNLSIRRCNIM